MIESISSAIESWVLLTQHPISLYYGIHIYRISADSTTHFSEATPCRMQRHSYSTLLWAFNMIGLLWCMSKQDMLIFRIGGELLKGLEDPPLFPEYLEDGGKEEQQ